MPYALSPVCDVAIDGDTFIATGSEPWLAVEGPSFRQIAGRFATITTRASAWDAPVRPLFRFMANETTIAEAIGTASLGSLATWTGRVPVGTTRILVSPTNREGRFDFRIESIERRFWPRLVAAGFRRNPRSARSALLTRAIGWFPESDNNLAWAIGAFPLDEFDALTRLRTRPLELDGIDRPRVVWDEAPPIRVAILAAGRDVADLQRTLASLRAQRFRRWTALIVGGATSIDEPDCLCVKSIVEAVETLIGTPAWFGVITGGDLLAADALALIAERRARDDRVAMVYGDEIVDGRVVLKPGWSPRLSRALPYLGRAVFADPAAFTRDTIQTVLRGGEWSVPGETQPLPLHRVLLSRNSEHAHRPAPPHSPSPASPTRSAIVVLTRDQPALLTRLVASVRARTRPGSYRLVIVDNGDADGPAAAVLTELADAADVTVLRRPGPFNFSAMCNDAARHVDEDILVFLNDDMEVLSDGWLDRAAGLAMDPDVGAVGARLTYPDGRLQHVGVLAGMGGSAGHFGAPAPGDDPGWAGRNLVLHETSAVTGACLAVAREKFEAVGGFDAEHLPVELSDIDLCFKLNARGWQTLVDPAVHLMHEESFSRGGATFRRLSKYDFQRAVFIERWRHVLRDDPVFHPALSLYSWRAALG